MLNLKSALLEVTVLLILELMVVIYALWVNSSLKWDVMLVLNALLVNIVDQLDLLEMLSPGQLLE